MTAVQMGALNAEIFHNIAAIAEDESKLRKLAKYLRRLAKEEPDPTLMSKEEFFSKIELSLEEARKGDVHRIENKEQLAQFLKSL